MKISGYYHLTKTPNLDLETEVMDSVYNFLMGILRNSPAGEYIMTYKHIFESLDKKWSESVERVPLRGHRTQRMTLSRDSPEEREQTWYDMQQITGV